MNRQTNYKTISWLFGGAVALFVALMTIMLNSCNNQEEPTRYVRKNIHSPEAQSDVEALNKALQIMRSKDCNDPTSWYYQGAIHWVPDTIYTQNLCGSYNNISDLKEAWDNCTHSKGSEIHFLVWHRLYIYHFEKIVRKLSGKKDFALPYWEYTATKNTNVNRSLHPLFMDKNSSLYELCRYDSLNMGYPISGETERALDITKLFQYTTYQGFNHAIDAAPHGAMHDYCGAGNDTTGLLKFNNPITGSITSTGLMGWVPTAAFDPIFWTHHSNIDRLWQQWTNSENGQPVTLEDLNSFKWNYVFFDENGKKVTYTNEEIIKIIYNLDYDFDDTKVQPKEYKPEPVQIIKPLAFSPKHSIKSHNTKFKLGTGFHGVPKGKTVTLTVSFLTKPKGVYEVYLNVPEGDVLYPHHKNFLGFMTFFGSDHKAQGNTCLRGCCGELTESGRYKLEFNYEVTSSVSAGDLFISIYKANKLVHNDLVVESVTVH